MERLPDGRYSIYLLFDGLKILKEVELTARDILVESPTTEDDLRVEDERIQRLVDKGVITKRRRRKPEINIGIVNTPPGADTFYCGSPLVCLIYVSELTQGRRALLGSIGIFMRK
jgi:hypothetical protein